MKKFLAMFILISAVLLLSFSHVWATGLEDVDWDYVRTLQDKEFLDYFQSLELDSEEAIQFFLELPVSEANEQIYDLYMNDDFEYYMETWPIGSTYDNYEFEIGMGEDFEGPESGQTLNDMFKDFIPLQEGEPVGNPDKVYEIGFSTHGFAHPWCLNQIDTAIYEASKYPNVEISVLDGEWDDSRQARQIDTFIAQGKDGILAFPRVADPMGPPVERALNAGIPFVATDRLAGTDRITHTVTGFFDTGGVQQPMYLIHKLIQEQEKVEAKVILLRDPLGSTKDSIRTGYFLRAMSYFPGIEIVASHHNSSSRPDSYEQVRDSLESHPDTDVIFVNGAEQGVGAMMAVDDRGAWYDRDNGEKLILLNQDDSREVLHYLEEGKMDTVTPFPPYLSGVGVRILLYSIIGEGNLPQHIKAPALPMITSEKETILGSFETITPDMWKPYAYGPSFDN